MKTQKKKDYFTITFGKRDYIYLAIIFVVVLAAVLIVALVPRYYKLKYQRIAEATKDNSTSNIQPEEKLPIGTACNTAQVIFLLKDVSNYYKSYSSLLAADNNLIIDFTEHISFAQAEAIATTLLPQIESLKSSNNLTEEQLMLNDDLFNLLNSFYNALDHLKET